MWRFSSRRNMRYRGVMRALGEKERAEHRCGGGWGEIRERDRNMAAGRSKGEKERSFYTQQ